MADSIWVLPVVSDAQVDQGHTCPSCSALMLRLSITGLHEDGLVDLPNILMCPDCVDTCRVVDEWRSEVRRKNRPSK